MPSYVPYKGYNSSAVLGGLEVRELSNDLLDFSRQECKSSISTWKTMTRSTMKCSGMGTSSFTDSGKLASGFSGKPGWGQAQTDLPWGEICNHDFRRNSWESSPVNNLTQPRILNCWRAFISIQQSSTSGVWVSSLNLSLRWSLNRSNWVPDTQFLNTSVRIRGVPSRATVESCSQRAPEPCFSRWRAAFNNGRQAGKSLDIKDVKRIGILHFDKEIFKNQTRKLIGLIKKQNQEYVDSQLVVTARKYVLALNIFSKQIC